MKGEQEQANHSENQKQQLVVGQNSDKTAEQKPLQQTIEFFIPPPIYINTHYYQQQLQGGQNPMKQLTEAFTCFDEALPVNQTPPDAPVELPITSLLKEELRQRNRGIYSTMLRILTNEGRAGGEESTQGLLNQLQMQMRQFLDVCARAKSAEIRYLTLRTMEAQTLKIRERGTAIRTELEQIKKQLSQQSKKE